MKKYLLTLRDKTDALTLRERVMLFAAVAGVVIFLLNVYILTPLSVKQAALRAQIAQEQANALEIDVDIGRTIENSRLDPDLAARTQLQALQADVIEQGAALRAMQRGLVAPDKIAALLEALLKNHGRLRLVSLKTLPVSGVNDGAVEFSRAATPAAAISQEEQIRQGINDAIAKSAVKAAPAGNAAPPVPEAKRTELLYRHGVEMTLQGSYLDMVSYMAALEAMPAQLFWAQARLDASDYPKARLTLVLYTLSLDQKWIAL